MKLDILKDNIDYDGCEDLESFGNILSNARLKKKIPISVVVKNLLISKTYIVALEDNIEEDLPEKAYVLGFIRSYSNLLEIESDRMVKLYKKIKYEKNDEEKEKIKEIKSNKTKQNNRFFILAGTLLSIVILIFTVLNNSKNENKTIEEEINTSLENEKMEMEETIVLDTNDIGGTSENEEQNEKNSLNENKDNYLNSENVKTLTYKNKIANAPDLIEFEKSINGKNIISFLAIDDVVFEVYKDGLLSSNGLLKKNDIKSYDSGEFLLAIKNLKSIENIIFYINGKKFNRVINLDRIKNNGIWLSESSLNRLSR